MLALRFEELALVLEQFFLLSGQQLLSAEFQLGGRLDFLPGPRLGGLDLDLCLGTPFQNGF